MRIRDRVILTLVNIVAQLLMLVCHCQFCWLVLAGKLKRGTRHFEDTKINCVLLASPNTIKLPPWKTLKCLTKNGLGKKIDRISALIMILIIMFYLEKVAKLVIQNYNTYTQTVISRFKIFYFIHKL